MVDRYTKIVLTVIAASLVVIAFRDIPGAVAQSGSVHVVVDSVSQYAFQYGLAVPVPVRVER